MQTGNHYLENLITAIFEKDQKKELTAEWQFETFNLEEMENGSLVGSSLPEQRKLVAKLAYLKTHQLTKIDEMKTRIPGYNYMVKLLSGYVPIIAFVIFPCFLFVNSYMYEKRKKTNDLLNVVPVSLTKLAASKLLTTTIFGIIITLLPIMLTFVIASCQSGLGANNYPIPILQNGTVLIMSISTFLFRVGLLYVLILFFFSILSFTIALFTDSYLGHAIGLMVFILLSQYSATAQPFLEKILPLFPSAYIDSPNIILGGIYLKPLASNLLTFQNGLIVLSIYILLLLSFSGLVIYKRQRI